MGDWSMLEGQLVDTVGEVLATTTGTAVVTGVANTKGNWVQLIAATTYMADGLVVFLNHAAVSPRTFLVDIGVGAQDSEVVLIPNIHGFAVGRPHTQTFFFPIAVPAGTRISARQQSTSINATLGVMVSLFSQGFLPSAPLGRVTTYGAVTADSGGTGVDPGGVAHTKGAYSQIVAATTSPIRALLVVLGNQVNAVMSNCFWLLDVAVGAGGAEQIIIPDIHFSANTASLMAPTAVGPFFVDIPAGTRLAACAQCDITDATDRLFDIVIYGID